MTSDTLVDLVDLGPGGTRLRRNALGGHLVPAGPGVPQHDCGQVRWLDGLRVGACPQPCTGGWCRLGGAGRVLERWRLVVGGDDRDVMHGLVEVLPRINDLSAKHDNLDSR